jgi:hypothetical protein
MFGEGGRAGLRGFHSVVNGFVDSCSASIRFIVSSENDPFRETRSSDGLVGGLKYSSSCGDPGDSVCFAYGTAGHAARG